MKKTPGMVALFCSLVMVLGCSSEEKTWQQEKSLSVAALSGLLQENKPPQIIYTGSLLQWRDEHVPFSRCVPCDAPEEAINPLLQNRNTPLVLYGTDLLTRDACPLIARLVREGSPPFFVLSGGLAAWKNHGLVTGSTERIPRLPVSGITMAELPDYRVNSQKPLIIDVRGAAAFGAGSVVGAVNIPLTRLHERYGDIPLDRPVVVFGEDGSQSLLAASFLLRKGVPVVARLQGEIKGVPEGKVEGGARR